MRVPSSFSRARRPTQPTVCSDRTDRIACADRTVRTDRIACADRTVRIVCADRTDRTDHIACADRTVCIPGSRRS